MVKGLRDIVLNQVKLKIIMKEINIKPGNSYYVFQKNKI
jgi:hypothetical protein